MTNTKKVNLIFLFIFFGDALVSPFLALNFINLGFDNTQLAILLALKPICSILGNFIYGHFSKDIKRDVNITKILIFVYALSLVGFIFAKEFIFCLILMIIWSLHNSPLFSFIDGIAEKFCVREHKKYFLTRMFGSIGYFVCLILGGFLGIADVLNYPLLFSIAIGCLLIAFVVLFFLKPFEIEEQEKCKISFKEIFKSKQFIKYAIFYFFVIGIWRITDDYAVEFFHTLGLSDGEWSFLYAGEVVAEILTLLILNKLIKKEITYVRIIYIGSILMMVRTFLFAMNLPELVLVISTGALRGIAWGMFLVSNMYLLKRMLGENLVTKAVTFLAVEVNLFSSLGNLFYLEIRDLIGVNLLYIIFGILQVIGIVMLFFVDFSFIKKENINEESEEIIND